MQCVYLTYSVQVDKCRFSTQTPIESNNAKFTSDLSQLLTKQNPDGNFLFSPVSLEILFAMVMSGTGGNTNQQIWKHIFNGQDSDRFYVYYYVESLIKASRDYTTENSTLKYATILAIEEKFAVKDIFKKRIGHFPNAEFLQENFDLNGYRTARRINDIVAQTTENKITNLISDDSLNDGTAMVLVNALYLKANFKESFTSTYYGQFYDSDDEAYNIEFLDGSFKNLSYHESADLSMIKLPFQEENFSLYVAMQNEYDASIDLGDVVHRTLAKQIAFKVKHVNVSYVQNSFNRLDIN
uniref:Serpin domain-containing protein n=1 Tax=Romanomermis culicivorax TaxID=13658 RepID=A0A915IDB5_ROMCU